MTTSSLRAVARVWAAAAVLMLLAFSVGELFMEDGERGPTPAEWVGLAFFPGGVALGHVLAFRREGLGGMVSVGSLGAFYLWNLITRGGLPGGPFFVLFAFPGFLFLHLHSTASRGPS